MHVDHGAHHAAGNRVTPRLPGRFVRRILLAGMLAAAAYSGADTDLPPEFYPEHHQVDALLDTNPAPPGVMLLIRNERRDALVELLPRAAYYAQYLQERLPGVHVAVISYGPELAALSHERRTRFPGLQEQAETLAGRTNVDVYLCGALAADLNLDTSHFPLPHSHFPCSPSIAACVPLNPQSRHSLDPSGHRYIIGHVRYERSRYLGKFQLYLN